MGMGIEINGSGTLKPEILDQAKTLLEEFCQEREGLDCHFDGIYFDLSGDYTDTIHGDDHLKDLLKELTPMMEKPAGFETSWYGDTFTLWAGNKDDIPAVEFEDNKHLAMHHLKEMGVGEDILSVIENLKYGEDLSLQNNQDLTGQVFSFLSDNDDGSSVEVFGSRGAAETVYINTINNDAEEKGLRGHATTVEEAKAIYEDLKDNHGSIDVYNLGEHTVTFKNDQLHKSSSDEVFFIGMDENVMASYDTLEQAQNIASKTSVPEFSVLYLDKAKKDEFEVWKESGFDEDYEPESLVNIQTYEHTPDSSKKTRRNR